MPPAPTRVSPELAREPESPRPWMYPWDIGGAYTFPLLNPELPSVHQTRVEMMTDPIRAALGRAGAGATALDLACCEGYFTHLLLEWGAHDVVGVDVRATNIRRAELIRDHRGVDP